MNKQMRNLVIMGSVLVLLVGAWVATKVVPGLKPAETTTTTQTALPAVFSVEADTVAQILVHNDQADLTLLPIEVKAADGTTTLSWKVDGAGQYPLATGLVEGLAESALDVAAVEEIAAQTADLAQYGLDQPLATLTVIGKDNSRHVIKIGNPLPSGNGDYVLLDNSGRVCSAESTVGENAAKSLLDLLDMSAVSGGLTTADLTGFTFKRLKDNLELVTACETQSDSTSGTSGIIFTALEPVARAGDTTSLTTLVNTALGLSASKYVELNPTDLAKYGLDRPQLTFVLTAAGKTVTLAIGQPAGDSQTYVLSSAVPAVYTTADSNLSAVDLNLTELLDSFVSLESIWTLDSIEFKAQDVAFKTEIAMTKDAKIDDESVTLKLDGRDAKIKSQTGSSLFSAFYQRLIGQEMAGYDPAAAPVNSHAISLTFHIKADTAAGTPAKTKLVEFSRRDDYTDYVFVDGAYTGGYVEHATAFTSQRSGSEGIIVAYRRMIYAMDHAADGVFNTEDGYSLD